MTPSGFDSLSRSVRHLYVRRNRYRALLMAPIQDVDGFYRQDLIPGICPAQDSCDQCRAARRACPKYQAYLDQSRALDIASDWGVESHLYSSAVFSLNGDPLAIATRWLAKGTERLDAYAAKYLGAK